MVLGMGRWRSAEAEGRQGLRLRHLASFKNMQP
jgi:hypothetical protein